MVKDKYGRTFSQFELYHPSLYSRTVDWWASGRMAITVKLNDGNMFEFDPLDNSIRRVVINWHEVDEDISRKEFGNNLLKMIPFSGMNSKELADEVGISTVMLSKYIHGKSTPNVLVARKLARALGCTVDELFDDTYTR